MSETFRIVTLSVTVVDSDTGLIKLLARQHTVYRHENVIIESGQKLDDPKRNVALNELSPDLFLLSDTPNLLDDSNL